MMEESEYLKFMKRAQLQAKIDAFVEADWKQKESQDVEYARNLLDMLEEDLKKEGGKKI